MTGVTGYEDPRLARLEWVGIALERPPAISVTTCQDVGAVGHGGAERRGRLPRPRAARAALLSAVGPGRVEPAVLDGVFAVAVGVHRRRHAGRYLAGHMADDGYAARVLTSAEPGAAGGRVVLAEAARDALRVAGL
jgi:hypothetical protein